MRWQRKSITEYIDANEEFYEPNPFWKFWRFAVVISLFLFAILVIFLYGYSIFLLLTGQKTPFINKIIVNDNVINIIKWALGIIGIPTILSFIKWISDASKRVNAIYIEINDVIKNSDGTISLIGIIINDTSIPRSIKSINIRLNEGKRYVKFKKLVGKDDYLYMNNDQIKKITLKVNPSDTILIQETTQVTKTARSKRKEKIKLYYIQTYIESTKNGKYMLQARFPYEKNYYNLILGKDA